MVFVPTSCYAQIVGKTHSHHQQRFQPVRKMITEFVIKLKINQDGQNLYLRWQLKFKMAGVLMYGNTAQLQLVKVLFTLNKYF